MFNAYIHPQLPKSQDAIPVSLNKNDLFYDTDANLLIIRNTGKEDIKIPVSEHLSDISLKSAIDAGMLRY